MGDDSSGSSEDEAAQLQESEEEASVAEENSPVSKEKEAFLAKDDLNRIQKKCKYLDKHPDPEVSARLVSEELSAIKRNLSLAVAKEDVRPGYAFWLERLSVFLNINGLHFSKADHIYLVRLLSAVAVSPQLESSVCSRTLGILTDRLLRGFYLKPSDMQIEWKPWYDLWCKYHLGYESSRHILVHQRMMDEQIAKAVLLLQKFFPVSATKEVLDEAKDFMVPTSLVHASGVRVLYLFLPTYVEVGKESEGYELWFSAMMDLWTENMGLETREDIDLILLFRRLSRHNMGRINWETFLPKLYTRVLKYFGLTLALPRSVGVQALNRQGTGDKSGHVIQALAELIVNTIDHRSTGLEHLKLLFETLENYYHPSNMVGAITSRLTHFMGNLLKRFMERLIGEREESDKWNVARQPPESFLTDEQVNKFVAIVEPSVLLSVFMKSRESIAALNYDSNPLFFVQTLAVLSPQTVLPDIFDKLYTALSSLTEPHQLSASLLTMAYVCPSVATEHHLFPGGRLKLLQLLPQLLPTLDPNDPRKLATSTALLSSIFFQVPFADCAQADIHHNNLTEEELELCHYTANFEPVLVELVRKYIAVFNSMRSIENFMEISLGSAQNTMSAVKSVGSHLVNSLTACLTSLIANSSKHLAKLLIQELFNYVSTTIIDVNSGFGFISKTFTIPAIEAHPDVAGPLYVPHVHAKLKELAKGHNLESESEVDKELLWYAAVFDSFASFRDHTFEPLIFECIDLLLRAKHVDIYKKACSVIQSMLTTRLSPYIKPSFWMSRSKSHQPLDNYVPILDFGKAMEFKNLEIEWQSPDQEGVDFVEKLVSEVMDPCVEKLVKFTISLRNTNGVKQNESKLSREELLKCLTIVLSFAEGLCCSLSGLDSQHVLTASEKCDLTPYTLPEEYLVKAFKRHSCLRKEVALKIHDLLDAMLANDVQENDTKSLICISKLLRVLLMHVGGKTKLMQSFTQSRASKSSLIGKKRFKHKKVLYVPLEVSEISLHYQLSRTWFRAPGLFGPTCLMLANDIWRLATSRYPAVRSDAQLSLTSLLHLFKYSSRIFVPLIEKTLLKPNTYHQYKGALYAINLSNSSTTLLEIQDFDVQKKLWIAVLNCYSADGSSGSSSNGTGTDRPDAEIDEGMSIDSDVDITQSKLGKTDSSSADATGDSKASGQSVEDAQEFMKRKSVLKILAGLYARVSTNCTTAAIFFNLSDQAKQLAVQYINAEHFSFTEEDVNCSREETEKANDCRFKLVECIIEELCAIIERPNVHSCVHATALRMLHYTCLRSDWPHPHTPVRVAQLALDATLSETAAIRTCGYLLTRLVLELNKVKALKSKKPLFQLYNSTRSEPLTLEQCSSLDEETLKTWISYTSTVITDPRTYNEKQFVDRSYYMYNASAADLINNVYATPEQQSQHFRKQQSNLNALQKFLVNWFSNPDNLSVFMKHLSAEEKRAGINSESNSRETGKFCRYKIWQFVFRLFMDSAFDLFDSEIQKVVAETKDSSHRFLAEFCGGAIHASKLWRYEQVVKCRDYILPILESKFLNVGEDTAAVWDKFISHALKDIDPMRVQWLFEWMKLKLRETFFPSASQYSRSGCLLAGSINSLLVCMNFEANVLKEEHLQFMLPFMSSRFSNYRRTACQSISSCVAYYNDKKAWCRCSDATMQMQHLCRTKWMPVVEQVTRNDFVPPDPSDENSAQSPAALALNELNSVGQILSVNMAFPVLNCNMHLGYPFLPALALVDGMDPNVDNVRSACHTIQKCAFGPMLKRETFEALEPVIREMSKTSANWRSKRMCLIFLQQLALSNIFLILNPGQQQETTNIAPEKQKLLSTMRSVIVLLLKDEKLEVRELASSALSGYIHCGLVSVDNSLLRKFSKLRSASLVKSGNVGPSSSSAVVLDRHAGVLGLKACINAFPYSVPDWMPSVLMSLAEHVSDPTPIEASVRNALMDFKRTHHDNWATHKQSFTEDQLNVLNDILISPSYYI